LSSTLLQEHLPKLTHQGTIKDYQYGCAIFDYIQMVLKAIKDGSKSRSLAIPSSSKTFSNMFFFMHLLKIKMDFITIETKN